MTHLPSVFTVVDKDLLQMYAFGSLSCSRSQPLHSFGVFTYCMTFRIQNLMMFIGMHSSLYSYNVSCATGCHTIPKHNISTPVLNRWQWVQLFSSTAAPFTPNIPLLTVFESIYPQHLFQLILAYVDVTLFSLHTDFCY